LYDESTIGDKDLDEPEKRRDMKPVIDHIQITVKDMGVALLSTTS